MEIQQSTEYSKFESITGNRNVNAAKIKKLKGDIEEGFNMLPYCPIIVSNSVGGGYGIIDGQHRFEASKLTNNPVYYVVCDTLSLRQIARLNSRGDKWTSADFLNCYIKLGLEDYKLLQKVMIQHQVPVGIATDLLMFNKAKHKSTEVFQSGEFKIKYMDETVALLELATDVFGRYTFSRDRYLLAALQVLVEKGLCDFERLKNKIVAAPNMMDKQLDPKQYLNNIEQVYNYKDSIRKTIF